MLKRRNSGGIFVKTVGGARMALRMKLYLDGTDPRRYQQGPNQAASKTRGTETLKRAGGKVEIHEEGLETIKRT